MIKAVRYFLYFVVAVQVFLTIAFFFQWPFVTNLWPYPGTTPLTFIFLSSIFAAAAASTLWTVATENYGALGGIGLDYLIILAPVAVLSFQVGASTGSPQLTTYGFICVFGALYGLALFLWSLRFPIDRSRPTPALVRWSFVIFVITLWVVAVRLIFQQPNVIPWMITPELSVLIGWMFMGASAYFVYALLRPGWANAAGQLLGFLAYDAVLIVPFLNRLPVVSPEHRLGLIIYTIVVLYSGLLAAYYLFLYKPTRLGSRGPQPG